MYINIVTKCVLLAYIDFYFSQTFHMITLYLMPLATYYAQNNYACIMFRSLIINELPLYIHT